jgi:hypothetical protein
MIKLLMHNEFAGMWKEAAVAYLWGYSGRSTGESVKFDEANQQKGSYTEEISL